MVARSKSKDILSSRNFFNVVLVSSAFIGIFIGAFLITKPKQVDDSQANSCANPIGICGYSNIGWDEDRYVEIDFDDSFYGPLTDQYFAKYGVYFEYDLRKGIGLYKVPSDNPLNPSNGYTRTVTSIEPWSYPLPGASLTESSIFLSFPSPVEKVQFQLQYDEPFDLDDADREVPLWSVMYKICDDEGWCAFATPDKLAEFTHNEESIVGVCVGNNTPHLIKTIEIRIEKDVNNTTGALPPPKLSLDNLRIQFPKHWEEPLVTPTLAPVDPGTCVCPVDLPGKENDIERVDECNHHDDYRYLDCSSSECVCTQPEY